MRIRAPHSGTRSRARPLRDRGEVILRFLGTGPAGGRPGRGRSHRTESSLLVTAGECAILIDVTRDFALQARSIDRVHLVLVTHPHRDAAGGLPQLERWLAARGSRVPLLTARATARTVRARHPRLDHLDVSAVPIGRPVSRCGWQVSALAVPHAADCTTLAWRLDRARCSIVYASDVAHLTPAFARFCARADLLVIDGAMWGRSLFTHLRIEDTLPVVASWPIGRVLFTQLGRSTPSHDRLDAWLNHRVRFAGAAYDGMELVCRARPR